MIEPIVVDQPTFFPFKCSSCPNTTGPMIDYHTEIAGVRVYKCQRCAKDDARRFGYIDGTEADARETAFADRDAALRAETSLTEQLGNAAELEAELRRQIKEQLDTIELLEGRVSQMENTIRESAEAARTHLELVGGA